MNKRFAETLKQLRTNKGLSQRELAERMFVNRSTVARWESGSRLPDAVMISRLSKCLGIDVNTLLTAAAESNDAPNVMIVDDRKLFLSSALPILEAEIPNATITGFTRPSEAIEYAKANQIALAFLDIEMGSTNGLDLCRALLAINPHTNVVYLTAHSEYAFDAWSTGASGFLLKPITPEAVQAQLQNLRYPFVHGAGANAALPASAPALGHPLLEPLSDSSLSDSNMHGTRDASHRRPSGGESTDD